MSNFMLFKNAVQNQLDKMVKCELFETNVDKDGLWNLYLDSFPEGTNKMYRERREYDCQCCKQFIRACGNAVSIINNELVSVWDINTGDETFDIVCGSLSKYVKSKQISTPFFHFQNDAGTNFNHQMLEDNKIVKWEHFYYNFPNKFINKDPGSFISDACSTKDVFKRGLEEITIDAIETVLELIDQNSIYRGLEFKALVHKFLLFKKSFSLIKIEQQKDNYCWLNSSTDKVTARIRNTAIGTLLIDLSNNIDINDAVKMFESKVAPQNYKRTSSLITKAMIDNAQKKVLELGIGDSLHRRFAVKEDISLNDILFTDRSIKKSVDVFDDLKENIPDKPKNLDKIEEISSEDFINKIIPKAESIEILFENKHQNNLITLVAPKVKESRGIFKWNNNFSWAYNGDVTDSIKEQVKKAGGRVDGVLRFSIQWNEDGRNKDIDFDAHCQSPTKEIYFADEICRDSGGNLDVDIRRPGKSIAVENITWPDLKRMRDGVYRFYVNNYSSQLSNGGFKAEIEFNGTKYEYCFSDNLRAKQKVQVAEVTLSKGKFTIKHLLKESHSSIDIWNLTTQKFHKVNMIMNSPNYWNNQTIGNKHLLFIIDSCKNTEKVRGFFNEYLKEDLKEHRRVFEVLGSKMMAEPTDNQLSGLGFSSTKKDGVIVKVTGKFTRMLKVNF